MNPILIDAANPSPMTGLGNNTYLIALHGNATLIDAGVGAESHLKALADRLTAAHRELHLVLVTHAHRDHIAGVDALAAVHPSATFIKFPWFTEDARYGVSWRYVADGDSIPLGDDRLVALHTPGHSPDHLAFWHEPTATVFTGDLVIPGGSVMIDWTHGGDLAAYLASLERLLALRPRVLLPAHGPRVGDPAAVLQGHIEHRRRRERQVVEALRSGCSTVQAIAESIYHGLDPALLPAARENVRAHLEKLKRDGAAADDSGSWTLR